MNELVISIRYLRKFNLKINIDIRTSNFIILLYYYNSQWVFDRIQIQIITLKIIMLNQKEEIIVALRRQITELEETKRLLSKKNEEFMKNESQADLKIKALTEMHASKVRTLLKSIQNLKKEVQKEKFEKVENTRVKRIQALEKELELMEVSMNAIRGVVNNEMECDKAIAQAFLKGPKRVRIASREELKIEIRKYKNMSLRLLEILKANKITAPAGMKIDANAGTGFTEDRGENRVYDIAKVSEHSQMANEDKENDEMLGEMGGAGDSGEANAMLLEQKDRLEENVVRLNMELRDKNERLLELLEELEDVRIQVYARDKSVALQQKQIEDLLEELRDAKSIENDIKILVGKKIALEDENTRLKNDLAQKFVQQSFKNSDAQDTEIKIKAYQDKCDNYEKTLKEINANSTKERQRLEADCSKLNQELTISKTALEAARLEGSRAAKREAELQEKINSYDGKTKNMLDTREQDIAAFRQRVVDLERELKLRDERLSILEGRVVALSTEVADKDYEINFYTNSIEELQGEIKLLQNSRPSGATQGAGATPASDPAELEAWKKKCKVLQLAEVRYLEEIEQLKLLKQAEDKERTVNNLVNRNRSKSKTREEVAAENDGIE